MTVRDLVQLREHESGGVEHHVFGQQVAGLDVYGTYVKASFRDGDSTSVVENLVSTAHALRPARVGPEDALRVVLDRYYPGVAATLRETSSIGNVVTFARVGSLDHPPTVTRTALPLRGRALDSGYVVRHVGSRQPAASYGRVRPRRDSPRAAADEPRELSRISESSRRHAAAASDRSRGSGRLAARLARRQHDHDWQQRQRLPRSRQQRHRGPQWPPDRRQSGLRLRLGRDDRPDDGHQPARGSHEPVLPDQHGARSPVQPRVHRIGGQLSDEQLRQGRSRERSTQCGGPGRRRRRQRQLCHARRRQPAADADVSVGSGRRRCGTAISIRTSSTTSTATG